MIRTPQFELDFFKASGGTMTAPGQRLTIFVDNTTPDARLVELCHGPTDVTIPQASLVGVRPSDPNRT